MKNYEVRDEYEKYLCGNNKSGSYAQYIPKVAIYCDTDTKDGIYYPDAIAYSFQQGDTEFAEVLLEELQDEMEKIYAKDKSCHSYYNAFESFVRSTNFTTTFSSSVISWYTATSKKSSTISTALIGIDGMDCLIKRLRGPLKFIKLAIENSFFFNFADVKERHCKIVDYIINHDPHELDNGARLDEFVGKPTTVSIGLPARKTSVSTGGSHRDNAGQLEYFDGSNKICNIFHDGNGNAKVCAIIRHYTGINLNVKTEKKPLKNYIISHIWGRATDPRYFTSLWNIVLVPAWANHLLDKDADNSSLVRLYKYIMQRICEDLYINNIKCSCNGTSCTTSDPTWQPWNNAKPCADGTLLEETGMSEDDVEAFVKKVINDIKKIVRILQLKIRKNQILIHVETNSPLACYLW